MPIEAQLADGRILEFPDGTDPSVIQSTVKRVLGSTAQAATASAPTTAPTPAAKQGATEPPLQFTDPMGGSDFSAIANAEPPKTSVLERIPFPAEDKSQIVAPGIDRMLEPRFITAVESQLNSVPEPQRKAALERLMQRPDVYGRAAKVVAERYAQQDKITSPTLRDVSDMRLEAQTERFVRQGAPRDLAEHLAREQAKSGQLRKGVQRLERDVVGERADAEAALRAKELEDAGFFERVGANVASDLTKSGLGLLSIYADISGDKGMNATLMDARRVEDARQGAIPKGDSIFERSAQSAISSLATQAPMTVMSMVTGTAAPLLVQMGVQQLGENYGRGRYEGLSAGDALTRAIPLTAAEIFFERFGMEKALIGLRAYVKQHGAAAVPKYVAQAIATEIPPEMATTISQYGIDMLPEVGLNKNPSLLGLYKDLEETLRQTVIQSGAQAGIVAGGAKGAQKLSQVLGKLSENSQPVYDGAYAELLARSKGFLTQERPDQMVPPPAPPAFGGGDERVDPTLDMSEFGGDAPPALTAPPPRTPAEPDLRVEQITQRGIEAGMPEDDARARAVSIVAAQDQKRDEALAPRISELQQEFMDAGDAPDAALARAVAQARQEAQDDALAESELAELGVSAPSVAETSGTGVAVAGRPESGAPAEGLGTTQPSGVAPVGRAPRVSASGEGVQSDSVTVTGQRKSKDKYDNSVTEVTLSDGSTHQLIRLNSIEGFGLAGWHDANSEGPAGSGYLGNTKDEAIQELISRRGAAPQPAAAPPQSTAPQTAPKKRGRPAVLTPEQKAQKAADKRPAQAAKAKADRAIARLTKTLDALAQPLNADEFDSDETFSAAENERRANKREAIKELLGMQADPNLRGTKVSERVKAALQHPSVTAKEVADLKAGIEAQKKALAAAEQVSRSQVNKEAADSRFGKFTNAAQALSHIIKTGTPFQQMLGKRLRAFVGGVKFVVIEEGQALPTQLQRNKRDWDRSIALYVENYETGERAIYVRGESFGEYQGLNNTTVLHELLHAATNRKIALAMSALKRGVKPNDPLVRSAQDLLRTMNSFVSRVNDMRDKNQPLPETIRALINDGDVLTDPREFVAYGMTDPDFQKFLMQTRGFEEDTSFFSRFVDGIRKLFGMDYDSVNALSDLIKVTDDILSARAPRKSKLAGEQASSIFGMGNKQSAADIPVTPTVSAENTIQAKPSANVQRLAKMLGSKLYGTPEDIARVSVKELFQNAFDAIKEAQELGAVGKGKVRINIDDKTRTVTVIDNGLGMPTSVMGNQFLQIAGTVKGTKRASGGLGVAKMLFLFENKKLEVVSLRDGVLSRMVTTGDDLKAALDDPSRAPNIVTSTDPSAIKQYTETLFPDGHGTAVVVQIPETYEDPSTGEQKDIRFDSYSIKRSPVLDKSPLFDDIEVVVDTGYRDTLSIGANFPIDDFTPFANVNFAWGTARIYVSKNKVKQYGSKNASVLSNGLWQFDTAFKAGSGWNAPTIDRQFYIDLSPAPGVKPEDPGYPFELNRQNFSKAAGQDFEKIANYISTIYSQIDFGESVKNFGTVQYVNVDGTLTDAQTLEPKAPPSDNAFTMIKPDDQVEVRDGVLYVNNREMPELTTDDLDKAAIKIDELSIPQDEVDANRVMVHDNTAMPVGALAVANRLLDFANTDPNKYLFDHTADGKSGSLRIYNLTPDTDNGGFVRDGIEEVITGTPEEIEQELITRGFMQPAEEAPETSLTDAARDKFGAERVNKYLAEIGATFQLLRNALVARDPNVYSGLSSEAVGVSVDIEYYGVNIRLPFRGMFINPATTAMHDTPLETALSMIGTMIHELAHFKVRNHGAEFPSEMQRIMTLLKTFPGIDLNQVEKNLEKHIAAHQDIFDFMNKEFKNGNLKARGNRFKDGSYQQISPEGDADSVEGAGGAGKGGPRVPQGTGPSTASAQPVGVGAGGAGQAASSGKASPAVKAQNNIEREFDIANEKFNQSKSGEGYAKALAALQMLQKPKEVAQWLRDNWGSFAFSARKAMTYLLPTEFMADAFGTAVPELLNTDKLLQKMKGMSLNLLKAAGRLTDDLNRAYLKDAALKEKLDRITHVSTLMEVDPSDPNAKERSTKLDKLWADLGKEGQRLYVQLKEHFEVLSDYFAQLLDEQITGSQLPIAEKANLLKKIRAMYETGSKITPFFPLVRRGDFWLSIGSGKTRKFFMYETMAERDRAMRGFADERIRQRPNESDAAFAQRRKDNLNDLLETQEYTIGNTIAELRGASGDASELLRGIFDAIDSASFGEQDPKDATDSRESLKDAVYQIYLQTMPEQSFRRQFIHRKGMTGFHTDILRSTAEASTRMATQLARLKYGRLLRNSLSQARDSIVNRPQYEPVVQAFKRRVDQELNPRPETAAEKVAAGLTQASFVWYLGGASSALLQPLSIFQTGVPVLGSKYGYAKTSKELSKMMKVWSQYGAYRKNSDGTTSFVMPTVEHASGLTAEERRAVRAMSDYNLTSATFADAVFDYKNTPSGRVSHPIVKFGKGVVDALVLGGLMHATERISREVLFMAAFRLNRQAGKPFDDAVAQAVEDTNEALFNYNEYNRPDFMRGAPGKVLTQFMMYPVHVTLFLLKNFAEMISPMRGRTRTEAMKKFFGTLGTTFVLAGAVGLPMFNTVMGLLGWAWSMLKGDDEDDDIRRRDFDLWFRKVWMQDQLGDTKIADKSLADIVERGPTNAITGLDISGRTSLNNLWIRDSKETATVRESATAMAMEKAGPTANMILSWAEAYEAFMLGDYARGLKKATPAGFRNFINAYEQATEGVKTRSGEEILSKDAFTTGELIGQAIGFRSDLLANTQATAFKLIGQQQKINFERTKLLNQIDREVRNENDKRLDKYLDEVVEFNHKYPAHQITGEMLNNSLRKRAEQRAKAMFGVELNQKNADEVLRIMGPLQDTVEAKERKNQGK